MQSGHQFSNNLDRRTLWSCLQATSCWAGIIFCVFVCRVRKRRKSVFLQGGRWVDDQMSDSNPSDGAIEGNVIQFRDAKVQRGSPVCWSIYPTGESHSRKARSLFKNKKKPMFAIHLNIWYCTVDEEVWSLSFWEDSFNPDSEWALFQRDHGSPRPHGSEVIFVPWFEDRTFFFENFFWKCPWKRSLHLVNMLDVASGWHMHSFGSNFEDECSGEQRNSKPDFIGYGSRAHTSPSSKHWKVLSLC